LFSVQRGLHAGCFSQNHWSPDVLEFGHYPNQKPVPVEVFVKLRAAALNRLGSWVRNGWSGIKPAYPHIPGSDGAGDVAEIEPGESVLEVGVSGGFNTASIPIAKLAGATVYVVGSGTAKLEQAESMGADFLIDRSNDENRSKKIHKLKDKNDVDAVVDNVSTTFSQCFCTAHNRGRILMVGNSSGPKFEIDQVFLLEHT